MPNLHPPATVRRILASLPGRYLLGALLLLGILVGTAWVAGAYLEAERTTRSRHLQQRQEGISQLRIIRSALWTAEHNLLAYSLTPERHYRERALHGIRNGRAQARELAQLAWTRRNGQEDRVRRVEKQFDQLHTAAQELIATRNDPDRLYPAMGLMRESLGPTNEAFLQTAQGLLAAMQGDRSASHRRARRLLHQLRYYWSRMAGEFRLFMTARIGLLSSSQDRSRKANLKSFHQGVETTLDELEALHRRQGLGLEVARSLARMRELEKVWFSAFQKVERLYTNRNWRADFPLITDILYPLYEGIQADLRDLNGALEQSAQREMQALSRTARRISIFPWALVGLHLFVVTLGFLYLRRQVLVPLSRLSRALRREAEGKTTALALTSGPSEIQALADAFRRMRQEVRNRQGALEHQAFHDPLTGLPNRALLEDRLDQSIRRSHRSGQSGAVMMLDLDFFKEINDTFGHPTGDRVLQLIGERMRKELRESDTVARFGGDEFCILMPGIGQSRANETAGRLLGALRPRLEVGDHSFHVSASIGIVVYPEHGEEAEALIRRADIAMYRAKEKRQGISLFQPDEDHRSSVQLTRTAELYEDILQDRIPLHFQPQWDLGAQDMVGGEALLRWRTGDGSPVAPPEALANAQRAGVLHLLTRRILNTAVREAAGWHGAGALHLAVNLTTEDLQAQDLPGYIHQLIKAWSLPPGTLELEITENDMMADPERALGVLEGLRSQGVRIAIDDYGTGYSSLGYLRGLPADVLKIDKSFVMDLASNTDNQAIVRSTVELGQSLGLTVVAEGVEDAASLDLLRQWRCDRAQGFHLGAPVAPDRFRSQLGVPARTARS